MIRAWRTWIVFFAALAVVLAAMGWISHLVLQSHREALVEETVRLALWRIDSALAPMFVEESSRPYHHYDAFFAPERVYGTVRLGSGKAGADVLVTSPLLTKENRFVRIHFQYGPRGELSSPQAPAADLRDRALAWVEADRIEEMESRLARFADLEARHEIAGALERACLDTIDVAGADSSTRIPLPPPQDAPIAWQNAQAAVPQDDVQSYESQPGAQAGSPFQSRAQVVRNSNELRARSNVYQKLSTQQEEIQLNFRCVSGTPADGEDVSMMVPLWIGEALVLARTVRLADGTSIQGCWIDWPELSASLLADIEDILPGASLAPVWNAPVNRSRMLVSLPVELVPGPEIVNEGSLWPVTTPLVLAWMYVIFASLAVGGLLLGTLILSERRATFVSAVTHELRTPLTTFRMYTEMLTEKMVPDPERQMRYLGTLRTEAERLGHMVENVLAYARLEKGRAASRREVVALGSLIDSVRQQLESRAERSQMELRVELDPGTGERHVRADASAVEQILVNLVDNACKYASAAEERIIDMTVSATARTARIEIRDHGPGITRHVARKLFRPFSKSAEEASVSAPGVGLGLALSRRLARAMGGDLQLEESDGPGARFVLSLPVVEREG